MKSGVIKRGKVVGFWLLTTLESGSDNSVDHDKYTVTNDNEGQSKEETEENQNRTSWFTEEN